MKKMCELGMRAGFCAEQTCSMRKVGAGDHATPCQRKLVRNKRGVSRVACECAPASFYSSLFCRLLLHVRPTRFLGGRFSFRRFYLAGAATCRVRVQSSDPRLGGRVEVRARPDKGQASRFAWSWELTSPWVLGVCQGTRNKERLLCLTARLAALLREHPWPVGKAHGHHT